MRLGRSILGRRRIPTIAVLLTALLVQAAPAAPRTALQPRTGGCAITAVAPGGDALAIPSERAGPNLAAVSRERHSSIPDLTSGRMPRAGARRDGPVLASVAPHARSHLTLQHLPRSDDPPH